MRFFYAVLLTLCLGSAAAFCQDQPEIQAAGSYAKIHPETSARAIAASLDDRVLAAQVMMTGIDGRRHLSADMKLLLGECPAGAIMLFKYNLDTDKEGVRSLLKECADFIAGAGAVTADGFSGIKPFIAVDHEGGFVHRFGPGVTRLPAAAFWGELAQAEGNEAVLAALENAAYNSGVEIHELGITMNLGPVAELINDDNRLFLDDRSFGSESGFVAAAAAAFISGMEKAGVACVVKHFPGNTAVDPHESLTLLTGTAASLEETIRPFSSLLASRHVSGIMVSHALVNAWDAKNIASLSPLIINEKIRKGMGFEGIVLSDDFSMGAASGLSPENAAVLSLAAGADMVMVWPSDIRRTHRAILSALKDGRLGRERLEEAAARIITEKIRFGVVE
jgi:beta-N-acetylhexosaminidase